MTEHITTKGASPSLERETHTAENHVWLGGQSARLTQHQKKIIRQHCITRDTSKCMICSREEPNSDLTLVIDHIDGNPSNHMFCMCDVSCKSNNLRLAHQSCNSRQYHRSIQLSAQHERERTMMAPQQQQQRQQQNNNTYEARLPKSAEIVLNEEYERLFRRYCFKLLKEKIADKKPISKKDMRITAREFTGCSLQSSYSYTERLYSPLGPFKENEDLYSGARYVTYQDIKDFNMTLEELEAKYPKEGKRYSIDNNNGS